ncbi:MAG: ATP-binding protein, partial [Candidatus Sumerlaeota bacterium]|nr:ATP-binding protein [Candidatus Sumerlaeota bacterium]
TCVEAGHRAFRLKAGLHTPDFRWFLGAAERREALSLFSRRNLWRRPTLMAGQAPVEEREYLQGMLSFERRAVIPLKWLILFVSLYFLVFVRSPYWPYWNLPDIEPFLLFLLYFLFNVAQSYFFYLRRVETRQIRAFVLTSFVVDLLFVTGLVYFDGHYAFGHEIHGDLYVFYFLVVLRGAAIIRSARGKLLMNVVLSCLFILALWQTFGRPDSDFLAQRQFAVKLALIWMVMLVSWFIVGIINTQAEQLLQARERLLRAENLATIGELAAGVAHEINNPIGIISANCEFLLRSLPPDDNLREEIDAVYKEGRRVQGIVAQLLDFSKPYAEQVVECDLRALNEEILAFLFRDKRSTDIKAVAGYDEPLPLVLADPNKIKQALLNVYLNARQAEGEKGLIEARFSATDNGKRLAIAIADDGPGITEEALRRAFEPFYTSRASGTGLGLTVTQRVVEALGGEIRLERREPRGTLVRIVLPAAGRAETP